jgi:hypothetical protein
MKKGTIHYYKNENNVEGPYGVTCKSCLLSNIEQSDRKKLEKFYSDMIYTSDKFYTEITEQFLCFVNNILFAAVQFIIKTKSWKIPIEYSFLKKDYNNITIKFNLKTDLKNNINGFSIYDLSIIEISKLKINYFQLRKILLPEHIKIVPQILFFSLWQRILKEKSSLTFLYCSADASSQRLKNLYENNLGFVPRCQIYYDNEIPSKPYTLYRCNCEKEIINCNVSLQNNVYLKEFFNSYEIIEL